MQAQVKKTDDYQSLDLGIDSSKQILANMISQKAWAEAKSLVENNIAFFQQDIEFLMSSAEVYTQASDFPAALKTYHTILDQLDQKEPLLFEVYKNMGNIYLKCGDVEAAEEKYNLANAINSHDEALIVNYGVLAIQKGEYDQAKDKFSQVVNTNSSSDLGWVGLALVHRAFADHDLARACLQRALDENAYNKIAISNYYQWCNTDNVDCSSDYINNYLAEFPEDVEMKKFSVGIFQ